MINKFSVGDKVVFSRSGIFGWEEIDESEQGDYHMGNNTYEVTEVDYTKGEEGIKLDFSNQWVHPNHFELAHYAKGGSVNTGRSWHLDRQKSNKSESWEKPMNKRKQRYDNGGGVGIDFTNFTIDEFYSFVRSINNYGDITYQVSLGNNVNKGGSAISIEKIRNISLSIGDAGRNISVMTGNENIYADILVYDNNYDKGYKEYTISLFSKDDREGLKSIVSSIIEKFSNGGGVDFGEEEFGDVLCLVKYITKDGAVKEHTLMTTGGSADDVMEKLTSFKGVDVLKILSIKRMDNVMEGIYSKGGGINSGRDRLFKSKQPHEQNYKRKTEWKEYKKEGWFGDWFADGGGVNDYGMSAIERKGYTDILVTGADNLKKLIAELVIMTFELDGRFFDIKDVDGNGIITKTGRVNWESISDRKFPDEDGLQIGYNNWNNYFYFKLTDEERAEHPYNNWMHSKADLEDAWRDKEDAMMANGGGVKKRSLMSVAHLVDWKGEGIKKWYIRSYPTDDLGEELNDTSTFTDLWNGIHNKENVYNIMGVGDSVIRERLFEYLSLIYDVEYSYVYNKWLESAEYANGGGVGDGYLYMYECKVSLIEKTIYGTQRADKVFQVWADSTENAKKICEKIIKEEYKESKAVIKGIKQTESKTLKNGVDLENITWEKIKNTFGEGYSYKLLVDGYNIYVSVDKKWTAGDKWTIDYFVLGRKVEERFDSSEEAKEYAISVLKEQLKDKKIKNKLVKDISEYKKDRMYMELGGGVDEITMTDEEIIRDSMFNGEIDLDTLTDIIGFKPNYPYQIVGAMKLEKCFLRPYYRIA